MAVAEVSEDRILLANPGNEAEFVINPVASVESVVHDVFSKLWSAISPGSVLRFAVVDKTHFCVTSVRNKKIVGYTTSRP